MTIELMKVGVKMRESLLSTARGAFRSACNHPFPVGFMCLLILLNKLFPLFFSLLLSASPILICTAVLLGVLLSYGEPNLPEIEFEEAKTTPIEVNNGRFARRIGEEWEEGSGDDATPLIAKRLLVSGSNGGETQQENVVSSEIVEVGEVLDSEDEKSDADSFGSEKVNVDSLDSPPRSPWKRIEDCEEEEEEDLRERDVEQQQDDDDDDDSEEAKHSDSGSEGAESSSPDASMADILLMLDELHPLLDEDTSGLTLPLSHSESDVASSEKPSIGTHDSDDESEAHEDTPGGEKEGPITWTDEDQRNLMDLGSSEIERNQRLEKLILRRRARRSPALAHERNLIDLDGLEDYSFGLNPISTKRQNPFDLPHDDSGLPPIPGSAPSVLARRRNPFDIPYGPNEEKPDLMGDGFNDEFPGFHQREAVFRKHESFNMGSSIFGPERRDFKSSPFVRQSSEISESKSSLVPETESVVSVEDLEDTKLSDENDNQEEIEKISEGAPVDHREPEPILEIENVSENIGHGSRSSDDKESSELDLAETRELEAQSKDAAYRFVAESVGGEGSPVSNEGQYGFAQDPSISIESTSSGALFVDVSQRAPVYDSSPRHIEHELSASSISPVGRDSEGGSRGIETGGVCNNVEILPGTSTHEVDEPHIIDVREHNDGVIEAGTSQESNVLVDSSEDARITQNPNMPSVKKPDQNISSDSSPKASSERYSSFAPAVMTADSRVNLQTTIEADGIEELDEALLSELDNVGDFSVDQWGHGSNMFEKLTDCSVDKIVDAKVSGLESGESHEIERVEQEQEAKAKTGCVERVASFDWETSENGTVTQKNESQTEINMQTDENLGSFLTKAESSSAENETTYQGQVDTETMSKMVELEATKIEDIDRASKEIITFKEPCEGEPVIQEIVAGEKIESFSNKAEATSMRNEINEVDHIDSALNEIKAEPPSMDNEPTYQGVDTETTPPMAELEARKIGDINPVFKANLAEHPKNDVPNENSSETGSTHETSIVEVGKQDDTDMVLSDGGPPLPPADKEWDGGVEANNGRPAVAEMMTGQEAGVKAPKDKIASSSSSSSDSSSSDSEKE